MRPRRPGLEWVEFFRHCANAGFHPQVVEEVGGYPTTVLSQVRLNIGLMFAVMM